MHLVAAVRRVVPEALQVTSAMATAGELPSHQSVITALSNELEDLPEPITIVLDDYHHVTAPRTHQLLSDLIRHPSPLVHLMIISREEPPLAIPKLRAQGRLSEIRMADLAFSEDELKRFMESELSQTLTAEQLDHIYASTEGWPAGARLAAQSFRLKGGAIVGAGFLDHAAQEYLLADVLDRAPDDVQRHLFAVSHVDQFSAALCDAISSDAFPNDLPGSEFIAWLRQHDLFLVQLDGAGNWYRFHHLFAGLLQHWRTTSKFADEASEQQIHEGAATALLDQGQLEDAIEQLELAGAHGELAATAATQGARLVDEERWVELARLISVIPSSVSDTDPNLLILHAWSLGEVRNRFSAMSDVLDRAEALLDDPGNVDAPTDRWLRGQITVLRGAYLKLLGSDLDGAIADAQAAQRLLSDLPGRHLTMAYVLEVVALASAGRSEEAHQVADAVVGDPRFSDAPFDPMSWSLPYIGWMEGDLHSEKRHALRLLAIGEQFGLESTILAANCFLGTVAYERNQLGEAERRLTYVFNRRYVAVANDAAHAGMALVSTQMALGRTTAADATAETLAQFVLETHSEFLQPYIDAFIAELDLRRGRTGSGLRWARNAELATQRYGYMWYNPSPAQIEVLLASPPDAERGRELLDHVLETARDRNHRPVMIRLLGLRALDLAERDDEAGALDTLEEAVRLAQPGGIVRRLADLGPRLIPLLQRLDVAADVLDHAGAILAAIETSDDQPSDRDSVVGHRSQSRSDRPRSRRPATPRGALLQQGDRSRTDHRARHRQETHGHPLRQTQRPQPSRSRRQSAHPRLRQRLIASISAAARRIRSESTAAGRARTLPAWHNASRTRCSCSVFATTTSAAGDSSTCEPSTIRSRRPSARATSPATAPSTARCTARLRGASAYTDGYSAAANPAERLHVAGSSASGRPPSRWLE